MKKISESLSELDKRFNSKKRMFWFGALQGAGAVVGATAIVLIAGFILGLLSQIPGLGENVSEVREVLREARQNQ